MFENIFKFFKKAKKEDKPSSNKSKSAAKERLHLVLMQDRANVSADFLDLMKQEIIDVIKKYIEVDESAIDVRLTNKENEDGTNGAPALYANIPIITIKNEARKMEKNAKNEKTDNAKKEEIKEDNNSLDEKQENASEEVNSENTTEEVVDSNDDETIKEDTIIEEADSEESEQQQDGEDKQEVEESTTEN